MVNTKNIRKSICDVFSNKTIYGSKEKISQDDSRNKLVDKITEEILRKYRIRTCRDYI